MRFMYFLKRDGFRLFAKKLVKYIYMRISSLLNRAPVNSKKYWDYRMKYNWDEVGGGEQSLYFAIGAFANIEINKKRIHSLLDYGCGTGGSCPALNIFFPDAIIYLYDVSQHGVDKGIKKYSRFMPLKVWDQASSVDVVYCSNVIEHISDPRPFVDELLDKFDKYIIIQCPWKEYHPDGTKITPRHTHGEHVWTIDEAFLEKFIFLRSDITWKKNIGKVELSWPSGEQLFLLGEKLT